MRERLFKTHSRSLILPPSYFMRALQCRRFAVKLVR